MIQSGRRAVVRIKDPIPVHLLYLTAWVGDSGRLNFREDLYDRDPVLWEALNNLPHEIPSTVAQLIAD
jgi:murein L,D-transpeptidase YcbB/YkuD